MIWLPSKVSASAVSPFLDNTIAIIKRKWGQLPATLKAFQSAFPDNALDNLTVSEYAMFEPTLKQILQDPYSLGNIIAFRDAAKTILERLELSKIQSNENKLKYMLWTPSGEFEDDDSSFWNQEIPMSLSRTLDSDAVLHMNYEESNDSSLEESLLQRRESYLNTVIETAFGPVNALIERLRAGEIIDSAEIDIILDPISKKCRMSRYDAWSAISSKVSKNSPQHLPIIASDAFYQNSACTAYSNRIIAEMSLRIDQMREELNTLTNRIWDKQTTNESDASAMVNIARVQWIFKNVAISEDEQVRIKETFSNLRESFSKMQSIFSSYSKEFKGINMNIQTDFLSSYTQALTHMKNLLRLIGDEEISSKNIESSPLAIPHF